MEMIEMGRVVSGVANKKKSSTSTKVAGSHGSRQPTAALTAHRPRPQALRTSAHRTYRISLSHRAKLIRLVLDATGT